MSMNTDIVYGYGFSLGKVKKTALADFIRLHAKTFAEGIKKEKEKELLLQLIMLSEDEYNDDVIHDIFKDYTSDYNGGRGIEIAATGIICQETGLNLSYEQGDPGVGSKPAILFPACYPWQMNSGERILTEENLNDLLSRYTKELDTSCPEYLRIEYYG